MSAGPVTPSRGRLPELAKYDVIEEIGHGGMATVYRAHDRRLGRDVAIKVIHPHLRDSEEIAHRFFVEAKAVAKLRHSNIVEVYDVSAPDDREQYLVVELLRGRTLRKLLQQQGSLPPEVAAAFALELLAALAHAHGAGVIHRDIKPENVIVEFTPTAAEGERVRVKLTDFGIAKLLDAQGVTSTGQVLGSPAHMAPEQIEGGEVDARADVFGLGVLLYECMVGHLPFEGTNPAQVLRKVLDGIYATAERERPTVGKPWSTLLDRALSHDPAGRFSDATAMRDAICAELTRVGVPSPRAELEAWCADPVGYAEAHEKKLIGVLCDLAQRARREGDTLGAASDYNRALAYAPHDKELLRIVSTMHRAEARARLVRRVAPIALGCVVFGAGAFFVTRAVRHASPSAHDAAVAAAAGGGAQAHTQARATSSAASATSAGPADLRAGAGASQGKTAGGGAGGQGGGEAKAGAPHLVTVAGGAGTAAGAAAKAVTRDVVVDQFRPPFGVTIAVDDGEAVEAHDGIHLPVDGQAHVVHFACKGDACEPEERAVPAGEATDRIALVALKIKPATLVVEGDARANYRLQEDPTVTLRAGRPATVPLSGGRVTMHVIADPSGASQTVTLSAGKEAHVTFATE